MCVLSPNCHPFRLRWPSITASPYSSSLTWNGVTRLGDGTCTYTGVASLSVLVADVSVGLGLGLAESDGLAAAPDTVSCGAIAVESAAVAGSARTAVSSAPAVTVGRKARSLTQ